MKKDGIHCPICGELLLPRELFTSGDTRDEVPWVCSDSLCTYTEFRLSTKPRTEVNE